MSIKKFKIWKAKGELKIELRGTVQVCDDTLITLTGELVGIGALEISVNALVSAVGSAEVHGKLNANWCNGKFEGGNGELNVIWWLGAKLGSEDPAGLAGADISIEGGSDWTWDMGITGNQYQLNINAKGKEAYWNIRSKVKAKWGKWSYTQELFRFSAKHGKSSDWTVKIPMKRYLKASQ